MDWIGSQQSCDRLRLTQHRQFDHWFIISPDLSVLIDPGYDSLSRYIALVFWVVLSFNAALVVHFGCSIIFQHNSFS